MSGDIRDFLQMETDIKKYKYILFRCGNMYLNTPTNVGLKFDIIPSSGGSDLSLLSGFVYDVSCVENIDELLSKFVSAGIPTLGFDLVNRVVYTSEQIDISIDSFDTTSDSFWESIFEYFETAIVQKKLKK